MKVLMQPGVDGCWREMGRPGPGTCPELRQHIVCRNCPHYAATALRLLDRPAPVEYVREWTEHLASAPSQLTHATDTVMMFRVESEWLALPAAVIEQVAEPSVVHTLPHRSLPVRGLVSVRGELVICVSLEALLGIGESTQRAAGTSSRAHGRLLVLKTDDGRIAFQPTEVHGLHRYHAGELSPVPATLLRSSTAKFTVGMLPWNGRTVGCLDAETMVAVLTRSLS
jgi:chemotaxis-related protein WspD